jgi:Fe-S-cluster-containing hydrogenase component 2
MLAVPGFNAERCVRYRYSYSECNRCADACPHEAIRLFDAGAEVLVERCQSCGLCVGVCQTEALNQNGISAGYLLKTTGSLKQATLACAPSEVAGDTVVPCLGALHPVVLAELSRQGIAVELAGMEHCAECAYAAKGPELIRSNLAGYEILCNGGDPERNAPLTLRVQAAEMSGRREKIDASRRGLFRRIVGHGSDVLSGKLEAAPAPLKAIRAAAPFVPERKALLNAMFADKGEAAFALPRHAAIPAEEWRVVSGCTHCEACVRVCPTGALQLLERNTDWRLAFLNDRCVACDVCAEVCQPGVLRQRDEEEVVVNKQKGRLLATVSKRRCARCERIFVNEDGGDICPICSGDDDDFASIFG